MNEFFRLFKKNKHLLIVNVIVTVTVVAAVLFLVSYSGLIGQIIFAPSSFDRSDLRRLELTGEENKIISVVKNTNPAVVSIVISKNLPVVGSFPLEIAEREIGGGTGFIVTPDGLVVTNKHVVDDPDATYAVYAYNGKKYPAEVVAKDPTQDIAIIRINGNEEFPYLSFGNSDDLLLGQTVIAIGNVFDQFKNSVSVGVISGLSRSIVAGDFLGNTELLDNVIQTDAAINPGNSGGPLLDTNERVVGVNVAIAQGSDNVGFALPSNTVRQAVNSVLKSGKIARPYLGVRYVQVNDIVQETYDLPYNYGALVIEDARGLSNAVAPGSPAARAGIKSGDVILEIDGQRIEGEMTIARLFQNKSVGDVIDLKIWHEGALREIKIRLAEFPLE